MRRSRAYARSCAERFRYARGLGRETGVLYGGSGTDFGLSAVPVASVVRRGFCAHGHCRRVSTHTRLSLSHRLNHCRFRSSSAAPRDCRQKLHLICNEAPLLICMARNSLFAPRLRWLKRLKQELLHLKTELFSVVALLGRRQQMSGKRALTRA